MCNNKTLYILLIELFSSSKLPSYYTISRRGDVVELSNCLNDRSTSHSIIFKGEKYLINNLATSLRPLSPRAPGASMRAWRGIEQFYRKRPYMLSTMHPKNQRPQRQRLAHYQKKPDCLLWSAVRLSSQLIVRWPVTLRPTRSRWCALDDQLNSILIFSQLIL